MALNGGIIDTYAVERWHLMVEKKDGQWKISRVINYGHDDMKNE
jgi:hypothetical protein